MEGCTSVLLSFFGNCFLVYGILDNFELVCVDLLISYLKEKKRHYREITCALGNNEVLILSLETFQNL